MEAMLVWRGGGRSKSSAGAHSSSLSSILRFLVGRLLVGAFVAGVRTMALLLLCPACCWPPLDAEEEEDDATEDEDEDEEVDDGLVYQQKEQR